MKLLNPTGWKIEGMAGGKTYYFLPFEEKDVWIDEHAVILLKSLSHRGLVHLQFSDSAQTKYKGDFRSFKKDQSKEGLKKVKQWVRERWVNERQAEMDVKHKAGAEADKSMIDSNRFSKDEETVESWAKALDVEMAVEDVIVKKRGRKPKSVGLANDTGESAS